MTYRSVILATVSVRLPLVSLLPLVRLSPSSQTAVCTDQIATERCAFSLRPELPGMATICRDPGTGVQG
ncbi:hypothetical protein VZT92_014414 [Zoarces viviparus]|uniref:Secreted protein n=1 Tax=Zoarces viviparus TaxID=48416 RepID=A0AAW1F0J1_ZOAVI